MSANEDTVRRHSIPIIYTKGTHYEVGYDVGRTFASIITSYVENSTNLNDSFLPRYETLEGRKNYLETLQTVKNCFPQYIRELQGVADGAKVPFHKLFLFHMDAIILAESIDGENLQNKISNDNILQNNLVGNLSENCTSICLNQKYNQVIGHTEDALGLTLTHFYFVSAHIISDKPEGKWGVKEEKFTSLCYAGHLPGYTMNCNHHGLVFTINTLNAKRLLPGKMPRHFITRALLGAHNFEQAQKIIRDPGCGAGDGCSFNMTFLNGSSQVDGRPFYNIEMAPAYANNESSLNILTVNSGQKSYHCNAYLRTEIEEFEGSEKSSVERMKTLKSYPEPKTKEDVIQMLGDGNSKACPVFRDGKPNGNVKTIAVGIIDCLEKTWSIFSDNPRYNEPIVVLPIVPKI